VVIFGWWVEVRSNAPSAFGKPIEGGRLEIGVPEKHVPWHRDFV